MTVDDSAGNVPEHLYVHVPFCARKCGYCAFYSVADADAHMRHAYLERVARELTHRADGCAPLRSVYIGGGTPSVLNPGQLRRLLATIRNTFDLCADVEFTLECNPGSLDAERIGVLVEGGVNRVSLGVQSFSPALRRRLGRAGAPDIGACVASLRRAGLARLSIDLIYGIAGESASDWRRDLATAAALEVEHVSAYQLTVEPVAALARAGVLHADEDVAIRMWDAAGAVLAAAGLKRYEISNYARAGGECRHNLEVWYGARFVGAGPAAAWYDGETRWSNPPDLRRWLAGEAPSADRLDAEARAVEILITGLRTVNGWNAARFQCRTGSDLRRLRTPRISALAAAGLLAWTGDNLRATRRGLLLADAVARELL